MAADQLHCPRCGAHSEADAQNFCVGEDCPLPDGEFEDAIREFNAAVAEQEKLDAALRAVHMPEQTSLDPDVAKIIDDAGPDLYLRHEDTPPEEDHA
jgi:hypothetical protein